MNGVFKTLLVACALVQIAQAAYPVAPPNTQSLAHLFFRSRFSHQDPAVSMACFTDYIFKSKDDGELYGKNFNQCLVEAKAGRTAINDEMAGKRIAIAESSENVCKRLSTCNGLNSTLEIFNCHANIGANNTKAVYGISGNASEYANIMHEKYRTIDLRHEQCCKAAERSYVEVTAVNYRTLKDCLEGRVEPKPTTTTAAPTTTTAAPTTTTAAPTTTTTTSTTTSAPPTTSAPTTTTATTTTEQPASPEVPTVASPEVPDVEGPTFPPGTEQFAKLLNLFK